MNRKELQDMLRELCSIQDNITHLNENSKLGDDMSEMRIEQEKRRLLMNRIINEWESEVNDLCNVIQEL